MPTETPAAKKKAASAAMNPEVTTEAPAPEAPAKHPMKLEVPALEEFEDGIIDRAIYLKNQAKEEARRRALGAGVRDHELENPFLPPTEQSKVLFYAFGQLEVLCERIVEQERRKIL